MRKLLAVLGLVVVLAACSGGSKKSSIKLGNDQASTPFCQDMSKLTGIKNPLAVPNEVVTDANTAGKDAPANIKADMQRVSAFYIGTLKQSATTTSLSPADADALRSSLTVVDNYIQQHCGIKVAGAKVGSK